MTKQELKKAIENGERVWAVFNLYSYENDAVKEIDFTKVEDVELHNDYLQYINGENLSGHYYALIFKTKAEAEHYLHHANVVRVEKLPFLTWEEFLEKEHIEFFNGGKGFRLYISHAHNENIRIITFSRYNPDGNVLFDLLKTEENFYKAYDECVRLFRDGD